MNRLLLSIALLALAAVGCASTNGVTADGRPIFDDVDDCLAVYAKSFTSEDPRVARDCLARKPLEQLDAFLASPQAANLDLGDEHRVERKTTYGGVTGAVYDGDRAAAFIAIGMGHSELPIAVLLVREESSWRVLQAIAGHCPDPVDDSWRPLLQRLVTEHPPEMFKNMPAPR
jgi:hypothetical protein